MFSSRNASTPICRVLHAFAVSGQNGSENPSEEVEHDIGVLHSLDAGPNGVSLAEAPTSNKSSKQAGLRKVQVIAIEPSDLAEAFATVRWICQHACSMMVSPSWWLPQILRATGRYSGRICPSRLYYVKHVGLPNILALDIESEQF